MEAIYRNYDSAPNNRYMFQFTAPCGLKNTIVISLLKLILIEYIILCLVLKKVVFCCFNLFSSDLIALICNVGPVFFLDFNVTSLMQEDLAQQRIWLGFCVKHLSGLVRTKIEIGQVNCLVSSGCL